MLKDYLDMLAALNGFDTGGSWDIGPGMGFGDTLKWWTDDGAPRGEGAHNGLDIRQYTEPGRSVRLLGGTSIVPAIDDGMVAAVIDDFLGRSVIVMHGKYEDGVLLSAYGHLVPMEGIEKGLHVKKGATLGRLSGYREMPVPPHLHLSLIYSENNAPNEADFQSWAAIAASKGLKFLDPAYI